MKKYKLKKSFIESIRSGKKNIHIAETLGMHPSVVSRILNEKRYPTKDFIYNVCLKMHMFPSEFLKISKKGGGTNGAV